MSFSDWLQIILTVIGFIAGATLSWVFFRAQQVTDFNRLRDSITDLSRLLNTFSHLQESVRDLSENTGDIKAEVAGLSRSIDLSKKIDGIQELATLKITVERMSASLDKAAESIISEVRGQQKVIAETVQNNFNMQSKQAAKDILNYLQRDFDQAIPSSAQRDDLIMKAGEIIEQAMTTMGKYQLVMLEKQQDFALRNVEDKANQQNSIVKEEVQAIGEGVASIERALSVRNVEGFRTRPNFKGSK